MSWNRATTSEPKSATKSMSGSGRQMAVLIGLAAVVLIGIGGVVWSLSKPAEPEPVQNTHTRLQVKKMVRQIPQEAVRQAMPKVATKKQVKRLVKAPVDLFANLKGADRKLAEEIQAGLDNDDLNAVIAAADKAKRSSCKEVRENAVDALGWFGAVALPELTGFMTDADEDVQEKAESQWELALSELDSAQDKFRITAAALGSLSNKDQLTSIGAIMDAAASDLINDESDAVRQEQTRVDVVQTLVDIINSDSKVNSDAAAEVYESVTGSPWLGIGEAERYLQNPEKYEAPDVPDTNQN